MFGKGVCSYCAKPVDIDKAILIDDKKYCCEDCYRKISGEDEASGIEVELSPKDIYDALCRNVYGQERAKKILSNAGYLHLKRVRGELEGVDKSNVLLIGNSGTGKTYLIKTLASILNVPYTCVSATALTENGYVGADVESVIRKLEVAAGGNRKLAEKGIVFIDEIDKLSGTSSKTASGSTVIGREGVQQALLKIIEGDMVDLSESGNGKNMIDTTQILFICAGAFDGLSDIIKRRVNKSYSIGFGGSLDEREDGGRLSDVTTQDLYDYGMMREFVGRFPKIAIMEDVTKEFLANVLQMDNSVLRQYERIFENEGVSMQMNNEDIHYIAEKAYTKDTGCRALRSVCDDLMEDALFRIKELKGKRINARGEVLSDVCEEYQE